MYFEFQSRPGEIINGKYCECSNMDCPSDRDTDLICGGKNKLYLILISARKEVSRASLPEFHVEGQRMGSLWQSQVFALSHAREK